MGRPPCGSCHCQCKPETLAQWVGPGSWATAPGVDVTEIYRLINRRRAYKTYQFRIMYDTTNADWIRDWYLVDGNLSPPDTVGTSFGGTIRDGTFYGGGTLQELPYRFELGCVPCRSCACSGSSHPSYGDLIYWPIREDVTTTPVFSEGELVDVTQTVTTDSSDYGRTLTSDEISRHHWWGNQFNGKPSEVRTCPPEMIVWTHSHGSNTSQRVSPADVNGILDTDPSVHICDGWTGQHGVTTEYSQRFRDVNIDDVDIIRLVQPMYASPSAGLVYQNYVAHTVGDIGDEDYDAITDWLDRGDKLLIIDGSAAYKDNMPAFVAKFSSLTVSRRSDAEAAYVLYEYDPGHEVTPDQYDVIDFEIRSHEHELTNYPETTSIPKLNLGFSPTTFTLFWEVTGGETLYSVWWTDITDFYNPVDYGFPAAAVETLDSGSRVIVAPTSMVEQSAQQIELNWSFYGNAGTIPNIRTHL